MPSLIRLCLLACLLSSTARLAAAAEGKDGFFKTSDGVNIHYIELGQGTPVILIHGFTSSAQGEWFGNGIAQALAKKHRVIAIDCRNHGKSDKPTPNGPGRPDEVIELMDHLKIQKAHFHGYSMGGSIIAQLMARVPERFISAAFGGSGVQETDPEMRAKVPADKEGSDPREPEALLELQTNRAAELGITLQAVQEERNRRRGTSGAATKGSAATTEKGPAGAARAAGPTLDLTKITFPVLAINGEFDRPNAKTHRLWRELRDFRNLVLPGKSHLTAVRKGFIPPEYINTLVAFINEHDPK